MKATSILSFAAALLVHLAVVMPTVGQKTLAAAQNYHILDAGNIVLWVSPDTWLDRGAWPVEGGEDHIFDGGLWVSDGERVVAWDQWFSDDWEETEPAEVVENDTGHFVTYHVDDSESSDGIGLSVVMKAYQFTADDRQDLAILEYQITNTSGADIENLYVAEYVDPDITSQTIYTDDAAAYDSDSGILYAFDSPGESPGHVGIALTEAPGGTTPHTAAAWTEGSDDPSDDDSQLALMSSGVDPLLTGEAPVEPGDYRIVLTAQPFELPADETIRIAFALTMGADPMELADRTQKARELYAEGVASEDVGEVPNHIVLEENYPNPFRNSTEIRYALPAPAHVELAVFDVMGREVARLVDGTLPAGGHAAAFDASNLPSGLYLYRLKADSFSRVGTMLVSK